MMIWDGVIDGKIYGYSDTMYAMIFESEEFGWRVQITLKDGHKRLAVVNFCDDPENAKRICGLLVAGIENK